MATSILTTVTNTGRQRHASCLATGKSFKITHFECGSQGHDPDDDSVVLEADPSLTETPGKVFGPELVDATGLISASCPYWTCIVQESEAVGSVISSISLIATIMSNGTDPVDEVGQRFVYAVGNLTKRDKTANDAFDFQVGVQI